MSLKDWENKVLSSPGAAGRVAAMASAVGEGSIAVRFVGGQLGCRAGPVVAVPQPAN